MGPSSTRYVLGALLFLGLSVTMFAQQPRPQTPSLAKLPPLFFSETWKQTGLERNVDNDVARQPESRAQAVRRDVEGNPDRADDPEQPAGSAEPVDGNLQRAGGGDVARQEQLRRPDRPREDPLADAVGWISRRPSGHEARRWHVARRRSRRRRRHDGELYRDGVLGVVRPLAQARHQHGHDGPRRAIGHGPRSDAGWRSRT